MRGEDMANTEGTDGVLGAARDDLDAQRSVISVKLRQEKQHLRHEPAENRRKFDKQKLSHKTGRAR